MAEATVESGSGREIVLYDRARPQTGKDLFLPSADLVTESIFETIRSRSEIIFEAARRGENASTAFHDDRIVEWLRRHPDLALTIRPFCEQAAHKAIAQKIDDQFGDTSQRISELEMCARHIGYLIGGLRIIPGCGNQIERLDKQFTRTCERSGALLEAYPRLAKRLATLRSESEDQGLSRALELDDFVFSFHQALGPLKVGFGKVNKTLASFSAREMWLFRKLYRHRFGMTPAEKVESEYQKAESRVAATLHLGATTSTLLRSARATVRALGASLKHEDGFWRFAWHLVGSPLKNLWSLASKIQHHSHGLSKQHSLHLLSERPGTARLDYLAQLMERGAREIVEVGKVLQSCSSQTLRNNMIASYDRYYFERYGVAEGFKKWSESLPHSDQKSFIEASISGSRIVAARHLVNMIRQKHCPPLPGLLFLERLPEQTIQALRQSQSYAAPTAIPAGLEIWLNKILNGKTIEAAAARAHCALLGLTPEWPGAVFYESSAARDKKIVAAYNKLFSRPIEKEAGRRLGADDTRILLDLIDGGTLKPHHLLRHAMSGAGASFKLIVDVLIRLDRRAIEQTMADYAATFTRTNLSPSCLREAGTFLFTKLVNLPRKDVKKALILACEEAHRKLRRPRNLVADLKSELSGNQRRFVDLLLRGRPKSESEMFAQVENRYRDIGTGFFARRFLIPQTAEGRQLERNVRALRRLCRKNAEKEQHLNPEVREHRLKIFHARCLATLHQMEHFRHRLVGLARIPTNLFAIGGALTATLAAYEFAIPALALAPIIGASSFVFSVGTMKLGLGRLFSRQDLALRALAAGIDSVTLLFGSALGVMKVGTAIVETGMRHSVKLSKFFIKRKLQSQMESLYESKRTNHADGFSKLCREQAAAQRIIQMRLENIVGDQFDNPTLKKATDLSNLWSVAGYASSN